MGSGQEIPPSLNLVILCDVIDVINRLCFITRRQNVFFCLFVLTEESWSLEDMLASLNSHYNKKVLLEMFIWPDDRDSSHHIIHVKITIS